MYKTMKKMLALCLALIMSAAAAGCSNTDQSSVSNGNDSVSSSEAPKTTTAPVVESMGDLDLSANEEKSNVPDDFSFECEAEKGKVTGSAVVLDQKFMGDYSGEGFVSIDSADAEVTYDVDLPAEGSYDITLIMAADTEGKKNLITLDGNTVSSFKSGSDKFEEITAQKVLLPSGKHTLGIKGSDGHIFIDSLKINAAAPVDLSQFDVSNKLSNPNASDEAKRLYNFLTDVYGKYIISGQSSGDNEGKDSREFKEIKKVTGKTPAMLSLDLIELSPSRLAHGAGGGDMVPLQAIDWYTNENGIVSLCWHWNAPDKYLGANGGAWWQGFYSEYTTFDLAKAMDGTDKEGYDLIVSDLDSIAKNLKQISDANVPVLWRPLHEAAGDPKYPGNAWFWWGSAGKDAYLKLWKLMYDKFTNEYGLNNLIWVWNGQNPSWYPGDDYVDIISYDCYPDKQDSSSQKEYFDLVKKSTDTKKIIAMSENGSLFDPEAAFNEGTRWAWFSTWNGEFTLKDKQLSGEYTSLDLWKKAYNSDIVLTLDELPDLKCYPMDTEKFLSENK